MGKSIAELRAEGMAEGMAKGMVKGKAEVLKNLGISEAEYQKILQNKKLMADNNH